MAKNIRMPDLVGLDVEQASAELHSLALIVQKENTSKGDVPSGKVADTYPAAGSEISEGSSVVLLIKRHPLTEALLETLPFSLPLPPEKDNDR